MRRLSTTLIAAAMAMGVTACAPEPAVEEAPAEVMPAETAAPEPTPTETVPESLVIPACEELVDIEAVRVIGGNELWQLWPQSDDFAANSRSLLGPKAQEALDSAKQRLDCQWAIPNSGAGLDLFVAELSPEVRDSLIADLRASDYVEGAGDSGAITFDYSVETPAAPIPIHYVFAGDAWLITTTLKGNEIAEQALNGLRSTNPTL